MVALFLQQFVQTSNKDNYNSMRNITYTYNKSQYNWYRMMGIHQLPAGSLLKLQ